MLNRHFAAKFKERKNKWDTLERGGAIINMGSVASLFPGKGRE